MIDLGIVKPGTTLYIPFATYDSNDPSASVTLTGLATTDIECYKNGSTTQRASDAGYALLDTDGIDFDGVTGIHGFSIDLADNTTAGFWEAGAQYWVVVSSITVDAGTVNFIAATFRIGYPNAVLNTSIASLSSQTSFTLTAGPAEDDALNGMWAIIHDVASAVQLSKVLILDYTGSTKTVTLVAGATFTAAATDNISIIDLAPLQPTTTGRTLDVSTGGEAGVDWANVGSPTTAVNLSATNIDTDQVVASVTGAVGSVTGAVGSVTGAVGSVTGAVGSVTGNVGGNVVGSVASVTARVTANTDQLGGATVTGTTSVTFPAACTVATTTGAVGSVTGAVGSVTGNVGGNVTGSVGSVATGGIAAASFAANAIDAAALATDAVTEIQSGLATAANLATVAGYLDTEIAAILADTNELQTDWADGGRLDLILDARASQTSVDDLPTNAELATSQAAADDATLAAIAALNNLSAAQVNAEVDTAIADAALATAANLATVAGYIDTEVAAIKAKTDQLTFTVPNQVDSNALTGGGGLDAAGVRAAIGLASANLDTQIGDLPTNAELATSQASADDATLAAIAALNNLDAAGIRAAIGLASANLDTQLDALPTAAEVRDSVWAKAMTELASVPGVTGTTLEALEWCFLLARNKVTQTSTTQTLRNDADSGSIGTATVSDDGTTATRGEWA